MNNRINVLSVAWSLPGGGISHYIGSIFKLNNFKNINICQVVIRAPNWNIHQKLWAKTEPIEIIIRNRADFRWLNKLLKILKEKKINVLMVHDFNGFIIGGISKLCGTKVPILATYHVPYIPSSFSRRYLKVLINEYSIFFLKFVAKRIITVSERYRKYLIKRGVKNKKIVTIHNGIQNKFCDYNDKSIFLSKNKISSKDLIFVTTSRLHPQKGLKYLLNAVPKVINQFQNIRFVILGTGPLEHPLKNQCVSLGIQNWVFFLGFQNNISEWLNGMDGFILPSLVEGHSIGLLEAMRANLPIICTPVGDNLETIKPNVDGIVVPEKDSDALAIAILTLAKNPKLRKSLGNSARRRFENNFTEEKMLDKTLRIIHDCANL
jgi:glycosyltransferase involved in cell wall biosynthesis